MTVWVANDLVLEHYEALEQSLTEIYADFPTVSSIEPLDIVLVNSNEIRCVDGELAYLQYGFVVSGTVRESNEQW